MTLQLVSYNPNISKKSESHNKDIPKEKRKNLKIRVNDTLFHLLERDEKKILECMKYEEINHIEEYVMNCLVNYTSSLFDYEIPQQKAAAEFKKQIEEAKIKEELKKAKKKKKE